MVAAMVCSYLQIPSIACLQHRRGTCGQGVEMLWVRWRWMGHPLAVGEVGMGMHVHHPTHATLTPPTHTTTLVTVGCENGLVHHCLAQIVHGVEGKNGILRRVRE